MLEKLEFLERKHDELERLIADPAVIADPSTFRTHSKAYAELQDVISLYREHRRTLRELKETREIVQSGSDGDASMAEMAREELKLLEKRASDEEEQLKVLLIPKDPNDEKSVIVEVRAGTGGEEAALFAAELFRMYERYAAGRGWKVEVMDVSRADAGGVKEVIAAIEGKGAYSRLKYESGVHRVQRVPATESQGRIHTSAVTVAVLPEAEEVEVKVEEKDLRIDRFCSSGPGGQSVNTTYSAIRITHIPTGTVVSCQDEKSQHKNRAKAMRVLRSRLYDAALQEQDSARAATRRGMVGSGDRAEKIRTYNFPQGRVSDHRIKVTIHQIHAFLDGELDEMLDALTSHYQTEKLKSELTS